MKMNAPQSLKFSKLKRRLGLAHWQAVGVLESLWLFTQVNAPAGDIGRHSDEDIAAGLEWDGDPAAFVTVLVECGWLDRCDKSRLVVVDWAKESLSRCETTGNKRPDLNSHRWRVLRLEIIEKHGVICVYCGADCSDDPTVDHVVPVHFGGLKFDELNLVVSCRPCNSRKGVKLING